MGELLYKLKYEENKSTLGKIISLLDDINGIEGFELLIPIPATNKSRTFQPVELIASALGERRNVEVAADLLANEGSEQLKGITDPIARDEMLKSALRLRDGSRVNGKKVLLVDDIYRSGSTLRVATELLLNVGRAKSVCVLTMTKTRSNR